MVKYYVLILAIIFSSILTAQEQYSKIQINLRGKNLSGLINSNIELDHGIYKKGKYFIGEFSISETEKIINAGFNYKVLIEDLSLNLHNHNSDISFRGDKCNEGSGSKEYKIPDNFHLGSMAGNLTYEEMLKSLDSMSVLYPDLITKKQAIDTFLTHDKRPIYWYKISDFANTNEDEPEVLYTALHHAREPVSMMQMIFYMWYVLENYGHDDIITYLVDNREMYFIPCINPDGYIYNQETNPDGGGYWRKNRRDNGSSFGVDLNRNYGFEWGFDNQGSSPDASTSTYRGPSGFSEPETQAVKYFCESHNFIVAFNYHTYGNLLIHPWGFIPNETEDSIIFGELGKLLTSENNYNAGLGLETVGYMVNGDSDDWMYGDTTLKNKILAMTPEVGTAGFWPNIDLIIPQCKENVFANISAAAVIDPFFNYKESSLSLLQQKSGELLLNITNSGLKDGDFSLYIKSLSSEIIFSTLSKEMNLGSFKEELINIPFTLVNNIVDDTPIQFEIVIDNGLFEIRDTIEKRYVVLLEKLISECDIIEEWNNSSGSWNTTSEDYFSPTHSITDSPEGNYPPNTRNKISSKFKLFVPEKKNVFLNFKSKWDIEKGYDWVAVYASNDGIDFIPLCGDKTVIGNQYQLEDEPVFDGTQEEWTDVNMDLGEFIGDSIYIQFIMQSDPYVSGDGFYFDELKVLGYGGGTIDSNDEYFNNIIVSTPNPASDIIQFIGLESGDKLVIENTLGNIILNKKVLSGELKLMVSTWKSGVYFYRILRKGKKSKVKSFVVIH